MILSLALALSLPAAAPDIAPPPAAPVRIWMKSRQYEPGDQVRVQVETGSGGYLLVLHYTPAGNLEVLFPVAPGDEAYVQADRRYEIRPTGESASFVARDGGLGLIFTALSEDPYRFDEFQVGDQWNAAAVAISRDTKDPEADLTALVQRMVSPRGFDYDVQEYAVLGEVLVSEGVTPPAWWSPTYVYVDNYGYGGAGCFSCGYLSPAGITIGVGFGWAWGYSPYYWGWPYSYWGYGYYPGYGYGYPYYPVYRPPYYPGGGVHGGYGPTVVGRPRGYEVRPPGVPEPHGGTNVARGGGGVAGPGGSTAIPARRARGGSTGAGRPDGGQPADRGAAPANGRSSGGKATGGGSTGGNQPAPRARPRGGDRPPEARIATQPNMERSRPEAQRPVDWVRVEDVNTARGTPLGRAVRPAEPSGRTATVSPPARRARSTGISSAWSQGASRASAQAARGGVSLNRAASSGSRRSWQPPSSSRGQSPRGTPARGSRPSMGGAAGGGGGVGGARPSSGGGGGRARGGRP